MKILTPKQKQVIETMRKYQDSYLVYEIRVYGNQHYNDVIVYTKDGFILDELRVITWVGLISKGVIELVDEKLIPRQKYTRIYKLS